MIRVLALIGLLAAPAFAVAQGVSSPYLQLVWRYRAGNTHGAVKDAATLPVDGLRNRVLRDLGPYICESLAGNRDCDDVRRRQPEIYRQRIAPLQMAALPAAVLLHLHVSTVLEVGDEKDASAAHRRLVSMLLERLGELETTLAPPEAARVHEFRRRSELLLVWRAQSDLAVGALDESLPGMRRTFPDDPDVLLASGWVEETRARPALLTDRSNAALPAATAAGRRTWIEREHAFRLSRAATFYRQALAIQPSMLEARVRLGRVLLLAQRPDDARAVLGEMDPKADPRFRYLATLFTGGIDEQAARPAAAKRAYEAAIRLWPAGQAARIALARLLGRDGDRAGAERLVGALPTEPPLLDGDADPWAWYHLGQAWRVESVFLALRAELRQ